MSLKIKKKGASQWVKTRQKKSQAEISESTAPVRFTSLPASMVALSLLPSSEPEATMALSMSPVAKWQTQYFSASRGALRWERICKLDYQTSGKQHNKPR